MKDTRAGGWGILT